MTPRSRWRRALERAALTLVGVLLAVLMVELCLAAARLLWSLAG